MKRNFQRVAIANRGEVAVRIIKACEELGLETLLLHSEADINSRAYRMATKTICIGPGPTAESYLSIEANIRGAIAGEAQAVHPGFGFLSENADFAEACEKAGLVFIGPAPESIRQLGDKVHCKSLAKSAGLPLVPGYQGDDQGVDRLVNEAEKIGFPVIVKAAAGGGGRGMKLLHSREEARDLIESAQREARSAFGSSKVFLEKYLDRAKHIEFQIFGDASGRVVHLFDRECSVQRRHQKIIEEALSPSLTEELRRRMGEAAAAIGALGRYRGAGTVEFLLQDGEFYLLEVNTRLQVEHPVTEMVLGMDLVKAQILTAMGEYVFDDRQMRVPRGHAIECRLYAENPYLGGIPSTGVLGTVEWPEGPGRRFEYGFEKGDEITSFYDPMIAKVIVWDETRPRAIRKMIRTLRDSVIFGVRTNIPYLIEILSHPEFVNGVMTTRFIENNFPGPLAEPELSPAEEALVAFARKHRPGAAAGGVSAPAATPWTGFWRGI
ncbi:MAG: ATP-grasp domain-containing protein [Bdellovibrionaceae bacterium]|nr:ATP-grasp domain-containing protein [Pseudobdellovibrionaceae bacterium]